MLLCAMFQFFLYLGNTGFYAANDIMYNMSGNLLLLLVNALKAP